MNIWWEYFAIWLESKMDQRILPFSSSDWRSKFCLERSLCFCLKQISVCSQANLWGLNYFSVWQEDKQGPFLARVDCAGDRMGEIRWHLLVSLDLSWSFLSRFNWTYRSQVGHMGISNKHYRHIHLPEFDYLFQISHISTPVVEFRYSVCALLLPAKSWRWM